MKAARILVLGVALAAGGAAAFLVGSDDEKKPEAPAAPVVQQLPTVDVLIAKGDIGMGTAVAAENFTWQAWPEATTGDTYVTRKSRPNAIEEFAGAITRAPFTAGEPIREAKLIRANGAAGFMAAILPSGMRAVSTEISPETGAGGFILPNDRVDVILSRRAQGDRSANASPTSETILTNVRVLAIDQTVEEKNGQRVVVGKTATIELTPRQAESLAQSRQLGTLSLALRSLLDASKPEEVREERGKDRDQHRPIRRQHQPVTLQRSRFMTTSDAHPHRNAGGAGRHGLARQLRAGRGRRSRSGGSSPARPCRFYGDKAAQFLPLGVGKSIVVDLPGDIKDVLVADPKIANAVVRTSRRAYIIGVAIGQTNVYFFDSEGRQLMGFDIAVTRDLNGIRAGLKRALPAADIEVEGLADGIMLTGSVASPTEAQQAYDLAARLAGDGAKVVNGISVRGRDQVMLKVTVAEVQRDVIKQLGIDLSGTLSSGQSGRQFQQRQPVPGVRLAAEQQRHHRELPRRHRDAARDGARRRDPHAGRAEPDRDLR